jgi:uncharacterized iron-regulated protein
MRLCARTILASALLLLPACGSAGTDELSQAAVAPASTGEESEVCRTVGIWLDPATGARRPAEQLMASLATRSIVLLGEIHDRVEHHRWQLHALAGLHAHRPELVVGFEMFPRAAQPALDDWSEGRSSEADFLKDSRWRQVWGYDPDLYLPLFHFARQNRLPMVAMNVSRDLVSRVGAEGWTAIPQDARQGVSDPAPATEAYRRSLALVFGAKQESLPEGHLPPQDDNGAQGELSAERPDLDAILESEDFARFVEAQLTWDRAMAEALFEARRRNPNALVVGILGRGHIEHGHGVPHQLADLGEESVAVLFPLTADAACRVLEPGLADAVFLVAPEDSAEAEPAKPRLGIVIRQTEDGLRVLDVREDSVAEAAGLAVGDIILNAATFPVQRPAELIEIVQRQAPGTWLPLDVRRDGETRRFVAEFPARFE